MSPQCETYLVPPGFQLKAGGPTGGFDCTAWAASRVIAKSTCGSRVPTGRRIRLLSDEPVPDRDSPGLNVPQVSEVAYDHFRVYIEQRVGWRALTWDQYEAELRAGRPAVIQVDYGAIADSPYDAGRGFRGGHAIYEDWNDTIDSLADGRAPGVYNRAKAGVRRYPRDVMREAAGRLIIGFSPEGNARRAGEGKVWAGLGRDVMPTFRVDIRPRGRRPLIRFRVFDIEKGRIVGFDHARVSRLEAPSTPPRAFVWPEEDGEMRFLVRIGGTGRLAGKWVHSHWAEEQAA